MLKYLTLRVIQVRRPEAEKFLVGAIGDITRRGLIGKTMTPFQLGTNILSNDGMFEPGGFLDYAGQPYEHRTVNQRRGINTPQGYLAYVRAINLGKMFSITDQAGTFNTWKIYYPTLEESQEGREPAEDPWPSDRPPDKEIVAPGWHPFAYFIPPMVGALIDNALGIPDPDRRTYQQLGVENEYIFLGDSREELRPMPAKGIVTLCDIPLQNRFSTPEVIREGGDLIVSANINTIFFGNPVGQMFGDRELTSKDIEYLRYHAFLYVDLNKLMSDMED